MDAPKTTSDRPKRRASWLRGRFSILGLLIVLTVLSLGLAAWNMFYSTQRQWAAIRPLLKNGAWVLMYSSTTVFNQVQWISA